MINMVGYSSRINDPAFDQYRKQSIQWSFLFASILAVIAIVAFPIYGHYSGEISWPDSLYFGIGIGAMFVLIASLQTLKRKVDKTWDGTVVDKQVYSRTERVKGGRPRDHRDYIVKIKKDTGGIKTEKWVDMPTLFKYYSVGDRVRHHKGFNYYEKYDKSKDQQIICAACNVFNDISLDYCKFCGRPLLK